MPSIVSFKRRLQGHVQQGGFYNDIDLRSGQAFQSSWESVTFRKSRLSMCDFRGSKWVSCSLDGTTFYGANANAANFHGVAFTDCDMEQASFVGAVLKNVVFRNCRLAYSTFAGATLHNVMFDGCNLHGASLLYAEATGVQYANSNLWSSEIALGCSFWNSAFGMDDCRRFAAMLARVCPDPTAKETLRSLAGELTYKAIDRLMRPESDVPEF